jgi:hypothetical protein
VTLPGSWAGLPAPIGLTVETERNGQRRWTECAQASCVMGVHNWRPEVPVTDAERDALDATPPHKALTATTIRERDASLTARYGWAGERSYNSDTIYSLLEQGYVGVFAGEGDYPGVTDYKLGHALAIGPARLGGVWIRDPLKIEGHWADYGEVLAWSWGPGDVALFPPNDPEMIAELQPTLGITSPGPTPTRDSAPTTAPAPAAQSADQGVSSVSVVPGGSDWALWGLVGLAAIGLLLAMTRKAGSNGTLGSDSDSN